MDTMTITEGLAELKTIGKRIEKKRAAIQTYLVRPAVVKDPLAAQGGSAAYVKQEMQSIYDLLTRFATIRHAVQSKNLGTQLTIEGLTRTVQGWLNWRKEIAPIYTKHLQQIRANIDAVRNQTHRQQGRVLKEDAQDANQTDVLINLDEVVLNQDLERIETILGTLDGKLSLLNATTTIEV